MMSGSLGIRGETKSEKESAGSGAESASKVAQRGARGDCIESTHSHVYDVLRQPRRCIMHHDISRVTTSGRCQQVRRCILQHGRC